MPPFHILFMAFTVILFGVSSMAQVISRNVTLDDTDPRVLYNGAWMDTDRTVLNFGGGHKLAYAPESMARITFIGDAVYFMSSLWPYHVTTQLSLNGGPRIILDLQDYDYRGPGQSTESIESHVVFSWTALPYGTHTLEVSVAPGEEFAIFDGLIYTERDTLLNPTPTASASETTLPSSSTSRSRKPTASTSVIPDPPATEQSSKKTMYIIGGVVGSCALCFLGYFLYRCGRQDGKRRKGNSNLPAATDPPFSRRPLRDTFVSALSTDIDIEVAQPSMASKGTLQPASIMWYRSIGPRISRSFSRRRPSRADANTYPELHVSTTSERRSVSRRPRNNDPAVPPVPRLPRLPDTIPFPDTSTFPQLAQPHSGRYPQLYPNPPVETQTIRSSVQPIRPIKVVPTKHTRSFSAISVKTTNYDEGDLYGGIAESLKHPNALNLHTRSDTRKKSTKRQYGGNMYATTNSKSEKNDLLELSWGSPPPPAYISY